MGVFARQVRAWGKICWEGIFSVGSLRIERSLIRNSRAGFGSSAGGGIGGGISALGSLEVIDSTITGNRAESTNTDPGNGGGISAAGSVMLVRSTVNGNVAGMSGGSALESAPMTNSHIRHHSA